MDEDNRRKELLAAEAEKLSKEEDARVAKAHFEMLEKAAMENNEIDDEIEQGFWGNGMDHTTNSGTQETGHQHGSTDNQRVHA